MTSELPHHLKAKVADWLQRNAKGSMRETSTALSKAYAIGASSAEIDIASYLTTRMPATYAAITAVLEKVKESVPDLFPSTLLDLGAGPGTASFASLELWPSLAQITQIEPDPRFAALSQEFLPQAKVRRCRIQDLAETADMVIAAYVLAEQAEHEMPALASKLWQAAQSLLIIIEPGTPKGFARIHAMRKALIAEGAHILGPCCHAKSCPMAGDDWCHFKTRLPRSRAHMQAKGAVVPFEDESYSWIAVSRTPIVTRQMRVIAPPVVNKVNVTVTTCSQIGVVDVAFASRDKANYKRAKKLKWGDGFDA